MGLVVRGYLYELTHARQRTEEAKGDERDDDEDERDGEVDKHGGFRIHHRQGSRHGFSDYPEHAHFSRFLLSSVFLVELVIAIPLSVLLI